MLFLSHGGAAFVPAGVRQTGLKQRISWLQDQDSPVRRYGDERRGPRAYTRGVNYDAIVEADEVLDGKPFTDPENTEREVGVMGQMLEHERERARSWREGGEHIVREHDEEGHRHLIVVPDTQSLLEAENVTAVGFFARPREEVDHTILFDLEDELIERMPHYGDAGLLSYYDVELVKGAYGNLILFSTPDVPPEWYGDQVHRRATEVSPHHYHEVRLHKGHIAGPLMGSGEIVVERTKYFDFKIAPPWLGLRRFAPAG
jgi:hypothetical protein